MMWLLAPLLLALPCPRLVDVEEELVRQRGDRTRPPHESVQIVIEDDEIEVQLTTPGTQVRRRVNPGATCAETTRTVATIIASWESGDESRTELDLPLTLAPMSDPPDPPPPPPSRHNPPPDDAIQRRPWMQRRSVDFDIAAAFVAGWQFYDFAAGGSFDARLTRRGSPFAASIGVLFDGGRDEGATDGLGIVRWKRPMVRLGAEYRLMLARVSIDLRVSVGLGAYLLYFEDTSTARFDPSLGGGLRLGGKVGPVRPFVGVEIVGWLLRHQIAGFEAAGMAYAINRFDALLVTGVAFTTGDPSRRR